MLESQKYEQEEIEYNNPRNEMDDMNDEIDTNFQSFQNLPKPKLKFRWLWLLFGVPFFIDLGIYIRQEIQYIQNQYTQNLKKLCLECQKKISKLKQDIIGDSSMDIKFDNIKLNDDEKNKYINDLTEKDDQINELEFQLRYITNLEIDKNYGINKAARFGHIPIATFQKINLEKILQEERINNIDLTSFKSPSTLNFKWSYLLFGIPFFIDLYKISQQLKRYTQDLVNLLSDYQKDLAEYEETFEQKQELINEFVADMQNESTKLNENESKKDKDVPKYQDFTNFEPIMTDDIQTDDSYISEANDYDNEFGTDQHKNFLISKENKIRELKVRLQYYIQSYKDGDR